MVFNMVLFYILFIAYILFFLFLYFYIYNLSFYLEFEISEFMTMKIEFLILIDWISLLFSGVVLLISSMVIFYSMEYMEGDLNLNRFIFMIFFFIFFMMLLIFMPNMISVLLGWDGLGLVSFCLVIYYQGSGSYNSGMVTVLINRVGDIMIMITISLFMMTGSFNFIFMEDMKTYMLLMLMIASLTKSAQIPFSSWLPLAMAAPTPVSALVHSSTLVTAGVYLLIRLNHLIFNPSLIKMLMLVSVVTMFLAGVGANLEFDLKKIIALSTLSQLGVMMFCLSLNLMEMSLFHLLTHAMFKSMLFMCAGVMIHNMLNYQDIRKISMVTANLPMVSMMFNCSSLSLCGVPFLSGFFSKDLILEMFMMNIFNKFIFLMLFISMGLTVSYSIRLLYYSFIKIPQLNIYSKYPCFSNKMVFSMYLLFFSSVMIGLMLNWVLFSSKNFIYLTFFFKMVIYLFMFLGGLLGATIKYLIFPQYLMFYCLDFINYSMLLWYMPILYESLLPWLFNLSEGLTIEIDLTWLEYLNCGNFIYLINYLITHSYYYSNYFYLITFFLVVIIIIILMF